MCSHGQCDAIVRGRRHWPDSSRSVGVRRPHHSDYPRELSAHLYGSTCTSIQPVSIVIWQKAASLLHRTPFESSLKLTLQSMKLLPLPVGIWTLPHYIQCSLDARKSVPPPETGSWLVLQIFTAQQYTQHTAFVQKGCGPITWKSLKYK